MTCIGQKGRQNYETFNFDNLHLCQRSSLNTATQERISLCHKFFTYQQLEGQNFYDFVIEMKKLSSECEFETLHDSLIKDMIVHKW